MGYSVAIKYTVELVLRSDTGKLSRCPPAEWRVRARYQVPGFGKPTVENLQRYVAGFEASTQPKGPNAHLGIQTVVSAFITNQEVQEVVATYAPTPANDN